jgi:hypothetical protein
MSEPIYLHLENIKNNISPDISLLKYEEEFEDKSNSLFYNQHFQVFKVNKRNQKKFDNKHIGDTVPKDFTKLQLSVQSIYSSAMNEDGIITAEYIYNYYQYLINKFEFDELTITDACANIGGNTIPFALTFDKVNAIEVLSQEHSRLKNNIKQYSLNNVNTILGDYILSRDKISQDIVFFDPPWGGSEFKKYEKLGLTLATNEVRDITEDIDYILENNIAKLVVLKGPKNTYLKSKTYLKSMVEFYRSKEEYKQSQLITEKINSNFNLYLFHSIGSEEVKDYIESLQNFSEESNIMNNKYTIVYQTFFSNLPTRIVNQIQIITDEYISPVNITYNIDNTHYESIVSYQTELDDKTIKSIQPNFKYNNIDINRMLKLSIPDDTQVVNKERLRQEIYEDILDDIESYLQILNIDYPEINKMINNYIFNKLIEKQAYDDPVIVSTKSEIANSKIFSDLKYYEKIKNVTINKKDKYNIVNYIQNIFSKYSEYLTTDKIISDGPIDINTENRHLIYWYSYNDVLTDSFEPKSLLINIDDFMLEKLGDKIFKNTHKYIACYLRYQYLNLNTVALAFDYEHDENTKYFDKDNTLECFSSVFNFYYNNWCSAFPDIENVFGSIGSFWETSNKDILKYDNIVVNPPFDVNIINLTLERFEEIIFDIKANGLNNNIVIILPHWDDMPILRRYKQNHKHLIINKNDTKFIDYFNGKKVVQPSNIIVFII